VFAKVFIKWSNMAGDKEITYYKIMASNLSFYEGQ